MSHFVAVVLVPKDESLKPHVETVMEPFYEGIEVSPYEEPCYCIGINAAHKEANEHAMSVAAGAAGGTLDELRESFGKLPEEGRPEWTDYNKVYFDIREQAEKDFLSKRDDSDAPKPDCEECSGTGIRVTTYNPQSHWDWFVIGGRWGGWIQGSPKSSEYVEDNSVPSSEYLASIRKDSEMTPFALVDPNGLWHERGKMGWFGCSSSDKDEKIWDDEIIALLERYPDTIAVAVDCHI